MVYMILYSILTFAVLENPGVGVVIERVNLRDLSGLLYVVVHKVQAYGIA